MGRSSDFRTLGQASTNMRKGKSPTQSGNSLAHLAELALTNRLHAESQSRVGSATRASGIRSFLMWA